MSMLTMKEDPDAKPDVIKLESELILDDDYGSFSDLSQEVSCDVRSVSSPKLKPDVQENIDFKSESGFSLERKIKCEYDFVLDLVPHIKVEKTENGVPSTDPFRDNRYQRLLQTVPAGTLQMNSSFSGEGIRIKAENDIAEDPSMDSRWHVSPVISDSCNESTSFPLGSVFITQENSTQDSPIDCAWQISSKTVSLACSTEKTSLPPEDVMIRTDINASEGKNQLIKLHTFDVAKNVDDPKIEAISAERYFAAPPDTISSLPAGSSASIPSKPKVDPSDGTYNDDSSLRSSRSMYPSEIEPRVQADSGAVVDQRKFVCVKCPAKFKRKEHLNNHLLIHSNERPFACEQCPARFKMKKHLTRHLLTHSNMKQFSRKKCLARFKLKGDLKGHLRSHSDARNLKEHVRTTHSDDRPFSCKQCPARFKLKTYLNKHLWIHSDKRPFSCEQCSASFNLKGNLNQHLRTIHSNDRPFTCKECLAQFKSNGHLKSHLRVHSDKRPFSCEHCPARFKRKTALSRHLRIHSY